MQFTDYGKALSKQEVYPRSLSHVQACGYDTGIHVLLTGRGTKGYFTRDAKSVYGAWSQAIALWGVERAWHVREDGTRKLIFRR